MQEQKIWIGLDVSKLSINYSFMKQANKSVSFSECKFENGIISNDLKGYADLEHILQKFPKKSIHLICEVTGVYNIPFCNYFYKKGYAVVENDAKAIKSFGRSVCNKGKTDKMDAKIICFFGQTMQPKPKFAKFDEILELERKHTLLNILKKQTKQYGGLKESFEFPYQAVGFELKENAPASILLNNQLAEEATINLKNMQSEVMNFVKLKFKKTLDCLLTIPQVGDVTAVTAIVNTLNFNRFENVNQFINYCGLVPRRKQSGTSVNGGRNIPYDTECDSEMRAALYSAVSGAVNTTLPKGKCKNKGLQSAYNAIPEHFKTRKHNGKYEHKHICIVLSRQLAKQIFVCGKYHRNYEANPSKAAMVA
jgi:transposase